MGDRLLVGCDVVGVEVRDLGHRSRPAGNIAAGVGAGGHHQTSWRGRRMSRHRPVGSDVPGYRFSCTKAGGAAVGDGLRYDLIAGHVAGRGGIAATTLAIATVRESGTVGVAFRRTRKGRRGGAAQAVRRTAVSAAPTSRLDDDVDGVR